MEETPEVQEDLGSGGNFKNWFQDNIRIILSVLIVVAIAAGIYSYSKRAEAPMGQEEIAMEEIEEAVEENAVTIIGENAEEEAEEAESTEVVEVEDVEEETDNTDETEGQEATESEGDVAQEVEVEETDDIVVIDKEKVKVAAADLAAEVTAKIEEGKAAEEIVVVDDQAEEAEKIEVVEEGEEAQEVEVVEEEPELIQEEEQPQDDVKVAENGDQNQTSTSEETDTAFIETAVAGDSVTTLSRKALNDYLEKNNDSSLTAEHKVYIEDYMAKKMGYSGGLQIGDQLTFQKSLIDEAIGQAKTLSSDQLENLKQYSSRVSTL